jgi:hypothetical protein
LNTTLLIIKDFLISLFPMLKKFWRDVRGLLSILLRPPQAALQEPMAGNKAVILVCLQRVGRRTVERKVGDREDTGKEGKERWKGRKDKE